METVTLNGDIFFKLRFNTMHGETNLYWRVIIGDDEYLAATLNCLVNTFSDESFDQKANATKWHLAGRCQRFNIDAEGNATFSN